MKQYGIKELEKRRTHMKKAMFAEKQSMKYIKKPRTCMEIQDFETSSEM